MKIATYNVNSIRQRLPLVLDWITRHKPDVPTPLDAPPWVKVVEIP